MKKLDSSTNSHCHHLLQAFISRRPSRFSLLPASSRYHRYHIGLPKSSQYWIPCCPPQKPPKLLNIDRVKHKLRSMLFQPGCFAFFSVLEPWPTSMASTTSYPFSSSYGSTQLLIYALILHYRTIL